MYVTIRGKRYNLITDRLNEDTYGVCDAPDKAKKRIRIRHRIRRPSLILETIIHEVLHAALWDLDENAVFESAQAIARILTKLGVITPVQEILEKLKEPRSEQRKRTVPPSEAGANSRPRRRKVRPQAKVNQCNHSSRSRG